MALGYRTSIVLLFVVLLAGDRLTSVLQPLARRITLLASQLFLFDVQCPYRNRKERCTYLRHAMVASRLQTEI